MNFKFVPTQQKIRSLADCEIVDILHTLRNGVYETKMVVPGVSKEDIKKGTMLKGYTMNQLITAVTDYNARKKVLPLFAEKILGSTKHAVFSVGKITTYDNDVEKDYRVSDGIFLHDDSKETQRLSTVHASVAAVLTVNPVHLDKGKNPEFVKADATGKIYPAVDVLTAGSSIAQHYVDAGDEKMVPRNLKANIAAKIAKNENGMTFYRDVLLFAMSPADAPSTAGYTMTKSYKFMPEEANLETVRYHKGLGQEYLGGMRSLVPPPKYKEMLDVTDPMKNVWLTHEKYRLVNGGDSGFMSNFTNPYYLGEIGADYEMVVPWAMDVIEFMRAGKYVAIAKVSDKKFNRLWPILACNVLVHDEAAPKYVAVTKTDGTIYLPSVGNFNMIGTDSRTIMKFRRGGMMVAPNVTTKSVKYADLDKAVDDIKNNLESSTFTHVLTYAFPELWKNDWLFVSPTRMPHTNMVWVNLCVAETETKYNLLAHCNRAIYAIQWKAYFPFHRKLFCATEKLENIPVHVVRIGKLLPVSFDDMVEHGYILDEDYYKCNEIEPNYAVVNPSVMRKNIVPDDQLYAKMTALEINKIAIRRAEENLAKKQKKKNKVPQDEVAQEPEVQENEPPPEKGPSEDDI